jgi:hypothetical protein
MEERDVTDFPITVDELEIEFLGAVEDVTYGWVGYTYDVSFGDRHPW